ncbi:hypothetical protein MJO28_004619 [Puccinia striiformis f. sp. tritici]|uniref:Glutathione S-transferase n=4 Tax=Puccinia striiformis TaxID=27350 RepID=A0A0L0V7N7_9BASI|nr:hypothetical protein Pst134EA_006779 [Puccinia striiformis f. sp. tritici]KAI9608900.1 hypothetical protein H4Q26_005092 [Puccinia striiformis f. sp. tritici PST-130]KNE95293.1 hypothetical protein PSTG_11377 [Puccinia striiformis f. sp. tritici PST-78]POW00601.1 hypothetical protein PSTT_13018 [Puccinia striiformis]KAH9459712.1 hypothetical protein Pst134EB_007942 [Puccinia striiformis f. sp. tritici]KAH9469488.1 hypothetical protein Pst134EA_006779 [Puccinia striiformis f. sp. tritici]
MPSYKLSYFDAKGRAEAIRLALHYGGIPFTDERLSREQFAEKKESFPFGQVPVLTVDEKTMIPQEVAILQYVGRAAGLYPSDREEALKVDIMVNVANDFYAAMMVFYMPDNPGKEQLKKMVIEEKLPKLFGYLEKHLAKNGTIFSAGENLTIADLRLYSIISTLKSGLLDSAIPTDIVDKYPHVTKLHQAIDGHEKVASWNKSQAK